MCRPSRVLGCSAVVALPLGSAPHSLSDTGPVPLAPSKASPTVRPQRGTASGNAVPILVLTPTKEDQRLYGLRVLAGICLALKERRDQGQAIGIRLAQGNAPAKPVVPEELWDRLSQDMDRLSPDMWSHRVTVNWCPRDGERPACEIRLRFQDEEKFPPEKTARVHSPAIPCPVPGGQSSSTGERHTAADAANSPAGSRKAVTAARPSDEIVFGPVTTEAARRLLNLMGQQRTIPILSASATGTNLTYASDGTPLGCPAFYRFISPDVKMAERLAEELVHGVQARRIGVLYERREADPPEPGAVTRYQYGEGLKDDLDKALRKRNGGVEMIPIPYASNIGKKIKAARQEGALPPHCPRCHDAAAGGQPAPADRPHCPECGAPPPQRAGSEETRNASVHWLENVFKQFRAWGVDAVGIFGTIEDKKEMLPILRRFLPHVLVFTTDADLGMEDFHCCESLIVGSPLDPLQRSQGRSLLNAYALLARKNSVQPDVYMLQARRATDFLLRVVERMQSNGSSAFSVFQEHRKCKGATLSKDRADRGVWFEQNGDLGGEWGQASPVDAQEEGPHVSGSPESGGPA